MLKPVSITGIPCRCTVGALGTPYRDDDWRIRPFDFLISFMGNWAERLPVELHCHLSICVWAPLTEITRWLACESLFMEEASNCVLDAMIPSSLNTQVPNFFSALSFKFFRFSFCLRSRGAQRTKETDNVLAAATSRSAALSLLYFCYSFFVFLLSLIWRQLLHPARWSSSIQCFPIHLWPVQGCLWCEISLSE